MQRPRLIPTEIVCKVSAIAVIDCIQDLLAETNPNYLKMTRDNVILRLMLSSHQLRTLVIDTLTAVLNTERQDSLAQHSLLAELRSKIQLLREVYHYEGNIQGYRDVLHRLSTMESTAPALSLFACLGALPRLFLWTEAIETPPHMRSVSRGVQKSLIGEWRAVFEASAQSAARKTVLGYLFHITTSLADGIRICYIFKCCVPLIEEWVKYIGFTLYCPILFSGGIVQTSDTVNEYLAILETLLIDCADLMSATEQIMHDVAWDRMVDCQSVVSYYQVLCDILSFQGEEPILERCKLQSERMLHAFRLNCSNHFPTFQDVIGSVSKAVSG